ncbi:PENTATRICOPEPTIDE REPEAT-CONTAINING PROTEIN [Salix koriyanagi]|uniref:PENTATRICOPEPTIDE REPEAT-CONTAINING PROTEIN n=1 Tax=Salix koriyanagi TaxID=2511006 RepID=A0A9Q0WC02_9ROSI|nr:PENTATRICOPEPTIDE REPEAT-CONTAINING PROTEIN [Salix koriyanagi]
MSKIKHSLKWALFDSIQRCKKLTTFKKIHAQLITSGAVSNDFVVNRVVEFFARGPNFVDYACDFLSEYDWKVSSFPFNALVSGYAIGYVRASLFDEAVGLFLRMDVEPNAATFVSVLVACGRKGYLSVGKGIHGLSFKSAFGVGLEVSNALMNMYVKCGCLPGAKQVFDELPERDIVSWTSIISGLVQCNCSKEALELFQDMQSSDRFVELDSNDSGVYVLLSNIHASNQRWDDVARIRRLMKEKGITKPPGSTVIELDGKAHEFIVGDTRHPQDKRIRLLLKILSDQIFHEEHREHSFFIQSHFCA